MFHGFVITFYFCSSFISSVVSCLLLWNFICDSRCFMIVFFFQLVVLFSVISSIVFSIGKTKLHFCCCFRFFVDSCISCRFWCCCVKFVSCLLPSSSKVHLSHFSNHFDLLWFVNACTIVVSSVFLYVSVLVCHWISYFHLSVILFSKKIQFIVVVFNENWMILNDMYIEFLTAADFLSFSFCFAISLKSFLNGRM